MPRTAKELAAIEVKRLAKPGHHAVGGIPGLALQITPTGAKSWILRTKVGGRRRDIGLGGYPAVTLAAAREQARSLRQLIAEGQDPILTRKANKSALRARQEAQVTFKEVASNFIAAKRPQWSNSKHAQQWENTLEAYAYPVLGSLHVQDIETANVLQALEPIWHQKPETAKRVQNRVEQILNAAKSKGYRTGDNPARWQGHLDHLLSKRSSSQSPQHQPALAVEDAPAFYEALLQRPGLGARALELQLLTATRSGEVRGARWSEFDFSSRAWIIPKERMKRRVEHCIPLSERAIELLYSQPRVEGTDLVFPGNQNRMLSDATLAAVIKRMNEPEARWVDPRSGRHVVPHGLRSTFRDWVSERTSFGRELAEKALAHRNDPTEAAYARSTLLSQRRPMMEAWEHYLKPATPPPDAVR